MENDLQKTLSVMREILDVGIIYGPSNRVFCVILHLKNSKNVCIRSKMIDINGKNEIGVLYESDYPADSIIWTSQGIKNINHGCVSFFARRSCVEFGIGGVVIKSNSSVMRIFSADMPFAIAMDVGAVDFGFTPEGYMDDYVELSRA